MTFTQTDDYNRSNANPIGGSWTTVTGQAAMQLLSNAMTPASLANDSAAYWNAAFFSDNQYAQCKVSVTGTSGQTGIGPMLRASTSVQTFYRVTINSNSTNNVALAKVVGGTYTLIWERTATFSNGDVVRAEASGTTIRVYINGVQVGADSTDSSIVSGRPGIIYSSASTNATADDFEAGNLNNCPALIGVGAAANSTTTATAAFHSGYSATPNDIHVVFQECEGADTPSAPSGYSIIDTSTVSSGTTTKLTAMWRRLVVGDTAPTIPDPGNHQLVRGFIIRGCAREGVPWDFFTTTQELTADTSVSITAGTSTYAETLCLAAFSTGQDIASNAGASAWADSSLISIEEVADDWQSASGLGGGFGIAKGEMLSIGAISAMTATLGLTANFKAHLFIAFKPDTIPPILVQPR